MCGACVLYMLFVMWCECNVCVVSVYDMCGFCVWYMYNVCMKCLHGPCMCIFV